MEKRIARVLVVDAVVAESKLKIVEAAAKPKKAVKEQ